MPGENASVSEQMEMLRRLNEQLTRSEARTRAIIEGIAEGVAVSSKDGCLEVFNRAATQIIGVGLVESDQSEWTSVYGLYLPDGGTPCPTDQLPLVRAINGEHVESIPLVVRQTGSDRRVHLSVTASPIYDEHGEIDGGVAIFQDVTERLRNERLLKEARDQLELRVNELKASEERYQDLYENAPDMYVTVDARTFEILECNRTLCDAIGYPKEEIVGHSVLSIHDPSCMQEVTEAFNAFQQSGVFPNGEFLLRRKAGNGIEASLNVRAVLGEGDELIQGRCVWRDITKRKRAEESLARHRGKMAHLNRVQTAGEMATGLAHELNQPLGAIVNYARGIKRRAQVGASVTPELHAAAEQITRESERAASIIDGLRRLVARRSPKNAPSALNNVVNEAVFLCRAEAQRLDVSVVVKTDPGIPLLIMDEIQIQQVVICLLLNAFEACGTGDEDGHERIDSPRVIVTTEQVSDSEVIIDVQDNGVGVTDDSAQLVFQAFYSTKAEGLGMGLAICRSIVENHGGRIACGQSPIGGAQFTVSLPIKRGKKS